MQCDRFAFMKPRGNSLQANSSSLVRTADERVSQAFRNAVLPLIVWMSDGYRARFGIDGACMRRQLSRPYSHDNRYRTLLGAMGVRTDFYQGKMDVLGACMAAGN